VACELDLPPERWPAPGGRSWIRHQGRLLLLFRGTGAAQDDWLAIDDACPHQGASLLSGELQWPWLRCPAHGLRFNVLTGAMAGASGLCLTRYPLRCQDGRLWLDEPADPESPSPEHCGVIS